jgi:PAS domain S-box-containing protein
VAEELQTLNDKLKSQVEEVTQAKSDLENLMVSTEIATLFLDRQLRVKRFTPSVRDLFHVLSSDVGRPLSNLSHTFQDGFLQADAETVLETLEVCAREAEDKEGRCFLIHTRPYRTVDGRIDGVVITFVDITERKQAEEQIRQARVYAEKVIISLPEPLLVLTSDLRVKMANEVFYEMFEVEPEQTEGKLIYRLGNRQWDILALRRLLEDVLAENETFSAFEVTSDFPQIGRRTMLLSARRLDDDHFLLLLRDISARKEAEAALHRSERKYRALFNAIDEGFCIVEMIFDAEGNPTDYRFLETNPAFEEHTGFQDVIGKTICELLPGSADLGIETYATVAATGVPIRFVNNVEALKRWYETYAFSLDEWEGHKVAVLFSDVTERLQTEAALRESVDRFQHMADTVPDVLFTLTATGEVTYISHRMKEYTGQPLEA